MILTNNEIKDIINVIKPLENRVLLLKGATREIFSKEGGFLNFLRPLVTASSPLMKSILSLFAKRFLILLGLSAETSAVVAAIQIKSHGSGITALLISNNEIEDIMKIVTSSDESGSLAKWITEAKEQKGWFLLMLLGTLAVSMLGNALTRKGIIRAGKEVTIAGENV